jgi:hypothetical protein
VIEFITEEEQDRIDKAYRALDAICKEHRVEVRANNQRDFWFECVEYKEPEPPTLKVV